MIGNRGQIAARKDGNIYGREICEPAHNIADIHRNLRLDNIG